MIVWNNWNRLLPVLYKRKLNLTSNLHAHRLIKTTTLNTCGESIQ